MRRLVLVVLAVAVVPVGIAFAQNDMKVTGGGQVIVDGETGSGDTIAFTAQQIGPLVSGVAPAKGQLQVIDRQAGSGGAQVKFHGVVTCIREFTQSGGAQDGERFIRFGGRQKLNGKTGPSRFTTDVQDNGEGLTNVEGDMILFRKRGSGDNPCDASDTDTELRSTKLARGNVQEH